MKRESTESLLGLRATRSVQLRGLTRIKSGVIILKMLPKRGHPSYLQNIAEAG
jgi:hypothetical protein